MHTLQPAAPAIAAEAATWRLDQLTNHILQHYHEGTLPKLEQIYQQALQCARENQSDNTALSLIIDLLGEAIQDLSIHFRKEEMILFPLIHEIQQAHEQGSIPEAFHCGTVRNPIGVMLSDHDGELNRFGQILGMDLSGVTGGTALLEAIRCFAAQLQEHIYLENHLLFPQAAEMEERMQCH